MGLILLILLTRSVNVCMLLPRETFVLWNIQSRISRALQSHCHFRRRLGCWSYRQEIHLWVLLVSSPELHLLVSQKATNCCSSSTEAQYRSLAQTAGILLGFILCWLSCMLPILYLIWFGLTTSLLFPYHLCQFFIHVLSTYKITTTLLWKEVFCKQTQIQCVATEAQLADIFTKAVLVDRFLFLRGKLMVGASPPISLRGV